MKIVIDSFKILAFFLLGILIGYFSLLPDFFLENDFSSYILYFLVFLVGFGVGANKKAKDLLRKINFEIVFVPLSVIIGSALGGCLVGLILTDMSIRECIAVSFGFGYYSLSSVIITNLKGETLGVIALLSNIIRELFTLVFTPILVKLFGKLAGISAGGATSMDTTLPVIKKYSGEEYAAISFFSGIVLTILVPFLVGFVLN